MNYFSILLHAPISIKIIIIGLMVASIWSWTIIFQKFFQITRTRQKFKRFEELFWSGESLEELHSMLKRKKYDPVYSIFIAGMEEWGAENANQSNKIERIENIMTAHLERSLNQLSTHLSFLSNLGSNGIIVGLLGTVLGIIEFFSHGIQKNATGLLGVAPGIAEALYATAFSLMASIPAAVAANKLNNDLEIYSNEVRCFIKEFKTIVARQS